MVSRPSQEQAQSLAHDIGALFLNFGVLEHTLSLAVAAAFKMSEQQERTFVRGMFARAKVDLLSAYAKKHWTDKYQKSWALLAKDLKDTIEFRNDFAHGTVMHNEHGAWNIITFRGGDRFSGKAEPVSSIELARQIDVCVRVSLALQQLADDVDSGRTLRP